MAGTAEPVRPYVARGIVLDANEISKNGNRKRFDIAEAARNWRGREDELERQLEDARRKGHVFLFFCAEATLRALGCDV